MFSDMFKILCLVLSLFVGSVQGAMQTLSTTPRVYYFDDFLSEKECDHIMKAASPFLVRSTVLSSKGGEVDPRRTSKGMFFSSNHSDPILKGIEHRIAKVTHLPIENGEGFQVLSYQVGGEYQPHYDYFSASQPGGADALKRGGQRVATLIMYLNDPAKGGETIFPRINVSVKPKKGGALLFYNVTPDGKDDPLSFHGGAPVIEGEKWIMTKWIRERPFF